MNFTNTLNGSNGFDAAGFSKSVILNQLGFDIKRAVFKKQTKDVAVADAAGDAELRAILGQNGLPQEKPLNLEDLISGYAAAFLVLLRHCNTANPDGNGKKPEHLIKWLLQPSQVIQAAADYRLTSQLAETKATAAALKADPSKRIAAIESEIKAQADAVIKPITAQFNLAVKANMALDDAELIDVALDAMATAGRDPAKELKRAAQLYIDSQKKRFETDGKFVKVDAGIYAMTLG